MPTTRTPAELLNHSAAVGVDRNFQLVKTIFLIILICFFSRPLSSLAVYLYHRAASTLRLLMYAPAFPLVRFIVLGVSHLIIIEIQGGFQRSPLNQQLSSRDHKSAEA